MDLKTAVEDTLDPRPIGKITLYGFGTLLEGVALGLLLPVLLPALGTAAWGVVAAVCFALGAVLAVLSYSALKRRYRVVEKGTPPDGAGGGRP
jgi:hypothetical protein